MSGDVTESVLSSGYTATRVSSRQAAFQIVITFPLIFDLCHAQLIH
jgi:hypothetical protein